MKTAAAVQTPRTSKLQGLEGSKPPVTVKAPPVEADAVVRDGMGAQQNAKALVSIAPPAGDARVPLPSMSIGEMNDDSQRQAGIQGLAMMTWLYANPKARDEIAALSEKWNRANQAGPNYITAALISGHVPGGNAIVRAWAHVLEKRVDSIAEKLRPLVQQQLNEVRADIARRGGDPSRLDAHDLTYFSDQFCIDLGPMRAALSRMGVDLDALPPEKAALLTREGTWGFDDRNEKVAHFSEAAVAPYRTT